MIRTNPIISYQILFNLNFEKNQRSEHERHSPICQFVRGDITENVPLSLTAANQAAHSVFRNSESELNQTIECTSEASSERYFAVSNSSGHIIVYDSKDILKVRKNLSN